MKRMPCQPSHREGVAEARAGDSAGTGEPSFAQAFDLDQGEQGVREGDTEPASLDASQGDLTEYEEGDEGTDQGGDLPLGGPGDVGAGGQRPAKRGPEIGESNREHEDADVADEGERLGDDGEAHEAEGERGRGHEQDAGAGIAQAGDDLV